MGSIRSVVPRNNLTGLLSVQCEHRTNRHTARWSTGEFYNRKCTKKPKVRITGSTTTPSVKGSQFEKSIRSSSATAAWCQTRTEIWLVSITTGTGAEATIFVITTSCSTQRAHSFQYDQENNWIRQRWSRIGHLIWRSTSWKQIPRSKTGFRTTAQRPSWKPMCRVKSYRKLQPKTSSLMRSITTLT